MALSLYDATVACYLQTLTGVAGFLDKGLAHFTTNNVDLNEIVESFTATLRGVYHPRLNYPGVEPSAAPDPLLLTLPKPAEAPVDLNSSLDG